jgi:hypothetical protein
VATLKNLDQDYLLCRDLRHQWDGLTNLLHGKGRARYLVRTTTCLRCGTERHETISLTTYSVLKRAYVYPTDYKLDEKTAFSDIRKTSILRQLKQARELGQR